MNLLDFLISPAHAAPAQPSGLFGMGPLGDLAFFGVFFIFMFFFTIRPQMKREKERKALLEKITKGDEIVITGGLAGKVISLGEAYLTVEIASNTEVKVLKTAVMTVLPKGTLKTL